MLLGPPAVLAVAVHLGTLGNALVYDDPLAVEDARRPLASLLAGRYGLTLASIHLDHLLWPGWVPGFHLTNVLLHGVATAAVTAMARVLGASRTATLWCGLFFAVHPVHVEAVASIENRKEILAALFAVLCVLVHRRGGRLATAGAVAAFVLAMSAKDVAAVGLVVMLPLADWLLGTAAAGRGAARRRVAAVAVAGMLMTAWYAGPALRPGSDVERATTVFASRAQAMATSAAAVPALVRLLLVPDRLAADHPKNVRPGLADPQALAGLAVLGLWLAAAAALARRAPLGAVALAWPVVMYAPLANVLVTLTPYPVAERYLYVPSIGVCLGAGLALAALASVGSAGMRRAAAGLGAALVLAGAARSAWQVSAWHDPLRLWNAALRAYPEGTTRIHAELGLALMTAGRSAEAIPHLEKALAIGPPEGAFYTNLGLSLWNAGRRAEAIEPFRRALALWPTHQMARFNLGSSLLQLGRTAEARTVLAPLADPAAWRTMDRSVLVALRAQNATPEALRASIAAWLATVPP
jgi:tetratricopeptide (TPR) repeat protein